MTEQTAKCPICEQPYKVYPNFVGDQSACPKCQAKAKPSLRDRLGMR